MFSAASTPVCVRNKDRCADVPPWHLFGEHCATACCQPTHARTLAPTAACSYKIVQQPSTVTSPGSPFVRGVGVSIERDYKSTLDTAGIVVSFALVDRCD